MGQDTDTSVLYIVILLYIYRQCDDYVRFRVNKQSRHNKGLLDGNTARISVFERSILLNMWIDIVIVQAMNIH